jgi:hypothetical protein
MLTQVNRGNDHILSCSNNVKPLLFVPDDTLQCEKQKLRSSGTFLKEVTTKCLERAAEQPIRRPFLFTARDNLERAIGKRFLHLQGFYRWLLYATWKPAAMTIV